MNGWRIEPVELQNALTSASEGVNTIASTVASSDGSLSPALGEQGVDVLARSTGFDGIVMEAVAGLMTDQLTNRVAGALAQYSTALESTALAAEAIRAGDEEQATQIATSMRGAGEVPL